MYVNYLVYIKHHSVLAVVMKKRIMMIVREKKEKGGTKTPSLQKFAIAPLHIEQNTLNF